MSWIWLKNGLYTGLFIYKVSLSPRLLADINIGQE